MFKKLLTISLATCLGLSCFIGNITKAKALDNDIMNYVISGSGTEDDPYVLAGDNEYKEMFDEMAKEAVQPTVTPLIDFSGTLTGAQYENQTAGGIWRYASGGPSASSDNALVILGITYNNEDAARRFYAELDDYSFIGQLTSDLKNGLFGVALEASITKLFGMKIGALVGCIFGFMTTYSVLADKETLKTAVTTNKGFLLISYKTSYHGSWFMSSTYDVWGNCPTVTLPGSYYGIGNYYSN